MASYAVYLDKSYFKRYAEMHGANPYSIAYMDGAENIIEITAEQLEMISRHILNFGNSDAVYRLAVDYGADNLCGAEFVETMTGHIADEILSECCRTVLES